MNNMEQKRFPEPFKFCEYYVEDFIKEANFDKVNMKGMYETLQKLRDIVSNNFIEVNYMTYDIEYHGWHGDAAKNMHNVQNALVTRLLEMYVICQMALGENIYDDWSE